MTTRAFGAPIRRNEDARLLRGQALFVDDVELPGMIYAAFLRSNVPEAKFVVAHGQLTKRPHTVGAGRRARVCAFLDRHGLSMADRPLGGLPLA